MIQLIPVLQSNAPGLIRALHSSTRLLGRWADKLSIRFPSGQDLDVARQVFARVCESRWLAFSLLWDLCEEGSRLGLRLYRRVFGSGTLPTTRRF